MLSNKSYAVTEKNRLPGNIMVANVVGKVSAKSDASASTINLQKNDVITEKYTVNVGLASSVTLVFSNGSTIRLLENATLVISEFLQDPFSSPFAMPIATEEPTTSVTKLNLINGEMVCNVKKLRLEEGSSMTVHTPVGAAGIRGTTFAILYIPDIDGTGRGSYTLSVTEGEVSLTDSNGEERIVRAGKEAVITFTLSVDPITGIATVTEVISMEIRDIPAERLNKINQTSKQATDAGKMTIFEVTEVNVIDALNRALERQAVIVSPEPVTDVDP